MMKLINESGMQFGPYPEEDLFQIEKSTQYTSRLMPKGIKSCEFILKRGKRILFVEAKTSNPQSIDGDGPVEKKDNYEAYINDIVTKMRDSIDIYFSILLKKSNQDDVGSNLLCANLFDKEIRFILVIKNAKKEYLPPLQEKLQKQLSHCNRIWKANTLVINEEIALKKGLVG